MAKNNLQKGDIIQTGLCYGYTKVKNNQVCNLPLMVAEIKDIVNKNVLLCKVIDSPETWVEIEDIHGIPLNKCILTLLGFEIIDKNDALCPGAPNFHGEAYEAEINGVKVQIIEDNNSYNLCRGKTAPTITIIYVHDIQNNKKENGEPLKINYMMFYPNGE